MRMTTFTTSSHLDKGRAWQRPAFCAWSKGIGRYAWARPLPSTLNIGNRLSAIAQSGIFLKENELQVRYNMSTLCPYTSSLTGILSENLFAFSAFARLEPETSMPASITRQPKAYKRQRLRRAVDIGIIVANIVQIRARW